MLLRAGQVLVVFGGLMGIMATLKSYNSLHMMELTTLSAFKNIIITISKPIMSSMLNLSVVMQVRLM